jgi:hypothetical protein
MQAVEHSDSSSQGAHATSQSAQPSSIITSCFLDESDTKLPGLAVVLLNWKLPRETVLFMKKGSIHIVRLSGNSKSIVVLGSPIIFNTEYMHAHVQHL